MAVVVVVEEATERNSQAGVRQDAFVEICPLSNLSADPTLLISEGESPSS